MSTIVLILALLLTSLIAVGLLWWLRFRRPHPITAALPFVKLTHRKLTPEERVSIENYLRNQQNKHGFNTQPAFDSHALAASTSSTPMLVLTPQSDNVYSVTRAITRYGVASDEPNKWRYYLDSIEVHLPSAWEQYITQDNDVELIQTQTIPLVISLNGHTLNNHQSENTYQPILPSVSKNASIRKEDSEHIELLNIRKETPEEYALHGPNGLKEACAICIALLLLFFRIIWADGDTTLAGYRGSVINLLGVLVPLPPLVRKRFAGSALLKWYPQTLGPVWRVKSGADKQYLTRDR